MANLLTRNTMRRQFFRAPTAGVAALLWCAHAAFALTAPNIVPINAQLVTSGQPTRESLTHLRAEGFDAVIYLAPSTVQDAIEDEPELLKAQGIEFVHVPIVFSKPTPADVEAAAAALERLQGKKVLVHCQVNLRASSIVFLYRTIWRHEDPAKAYESVSRVWVPEGPWKRLITQELKDHQVRFEPM